MHSEKAVKEIQCSSYFTMQPEQFNVIKLLTLKTYKYFVIKWHFSKHHQTKDS